MLSIKDLFGAVRLNNLKQLEERLDNCQRQCPDCNLINATHENTTCLELAWTMKHYQLIPVIIRAGATIEDKLLDEATLLAILRANDLQALNVFISTFKKKKISSNLKDLFNLPIAEPLTALCVAAQTCRVEIMQALLTAGAKFDSNWHTNYAPIHAAAHKNNIPVLKFLISYQVDLNARTYKGETAALTAAKRNHAEFLAELIAGGASHKIGVDLDSQNNSGWGPIHMAARENSSDSLAVLLQHNVDVNARVSNKKQGLTALFIAVRIQHFESAELLAKDQNIQIDLRCTEADYTALYVSGILGNVSIFKCLLAANADPYAQIVVDGRPMTIGLFLKQPTNTILSGTQSIKVSHDSVLAVIDALPVIYKKAYPEGYQFTYYYNKPDEKAPYCTYNKAGDRISTFVKSETLGQGSFGSVSLFQNVNDHDAEYVVKELLDRKVINHDVYAHRFHAYQREAYFNYLIYQVGAFYCDKQLSPKSGSRNDNSIFRPRVYILMKHVPGVMLKNYFSTKTWHHYLKVCIGVLEALQNLHKHFIHCDINGDNIIVHEDPNSNVKIALVDFNLSQYSGKLINTSAYYADQLPPEFKNKILVEAAASFDVYKAGGIFKKYAGLVVQNDKWLQDSVKSICELMQHSDLAQRLTIDNALAALKDIQKKKMVSFVEKMTSRLLKLRDECESYTDFFNSSYWFLFEEALLVLRGDDIESAISKFYPIYKTIREVKYAGDDGMTRFLNLDNIDLMTVLSDINLRSNRLVFLKSYHFKNNLRLSQMMNSDKKVDDLLQKFNTSQRSAVLRMLISSYQVQITRSPTQAKQWCYLHLLTNDLLIKPSSPFAPILETYKRVLNDDWSKTYNFRLESFANFKDLLDSTPIEYQADLLATLGADLVGSCIKTMAQWQEITDLLQPEQKIQFQLFLGNNFLASLNGYQESFLNVPENLTAHWQMLLDPRFAPDAGDIFLKSIFAPLIKAQGFKNSLIICKEFANQPELYKRILIIFNQVYRERRSANPAKYYSVLGIGFYSRQEKIKASEQLELSVLNRPSATNFFKRGVLKQGDLGLIAVQMKNAFS